MNFEQYEHQYGEGKSALVWVFSELKGKHRENCLCYQCLRFKPGQKDNCGIAQDTFNNCVKHDLVTPVYECPIFIEGKPTFKISIGQLLIDSIKNFIKKLW